MITFVLLLAQAATPAAPAPTPTPAPAPTARPAATLGRAPVAARPKTLSEHAAEMKTKGQSPRAVSFDDVKTGTSVPPPDAGDEAAEAGGKAGAASGGKGAEAKAASDAQKRMDRAVEKGLAVPERTSSSRRAGARREWDAAAEACRRTPGCVPRYRDDPTFGENKPLKTDDELIDDVRKRGFSEPHPAPK